MSFDVDEVLGRLTLEEKAALTIGHGSWRVAPVERLGVPGLTLADGPHGVRKAANLDEPSAHGTLPATCFPTASLLGATWDTELVTEVGGALGREARAMGVDVLLGPGVNMKRTPLCGRNFEYFSEDPLVAGRLGAAYVRGLQGEGVDACVKHFAVNNQEHRRFSVDAIVDERAMREIYLPAFQATVEAGAASVMSAYNRVNGTFASEHRHLLTEILRDEWGFDGAVISDWGAVDNRVDSIAAGLDLQMPEDGADRIEETVTAVRRGRLKEEHLDRAVRAVLTLIARAAERRTRPPVPVDPDAQHALARRTAAAGAVLLRNDPVDGIPLLPLVRDGVAPRQIALIGAFAGEPRFQGSGSSRVVSDRVTNLRDELRAQLPDSTIRYVPGYRRNDAQDSGPFRQIAVREAADADLVVLVVGLPEWAETEGMDRQSLNLPGPQELLLRACADTNPNTVVVVISGSPVAFPWRDEVPAVLHAYLGGQAAGAAIADVLTGVAEPGGRLAESFPDELSHNPVQKIPRGPRQTEYRESVFVGYRWYDTADVTVGYPFGHGLGYTEFEWTDTAISAEHISADDVTAGRLEVAVTVTNIGERAGSDVVQVYVERTDDGIFRPRRTLAGFAKVHLEAGESQRVTIPVDPAGLRHWSVGLRRFLIEDGSWKVHLSSSIAAVRATHEVVTSGGVEPFTSPECRVYRDLATRHEFTRGEFSRRFFEELLDQDLPDNVADRPGQYTRNTPLADVQDRALGRRLREVVAVALRLQSSDGTQFAGDPRDLALEITPRIMLQEGLTPEMVQTIVDGLNGDWRRAIRDGRDVVKVLAGTRRERVWRRLRGR